MTPSSDTEDQVATILLGVARSSLREAAGLGASLSENTDCLKHKGACFVTLRSGGLLRGCIGSIRAYRPLVEDVAANTRAAALQDPRFSPVVAEELEEIEIEVSVLSETERLEVRSEADLVETLRPGVDGAILEYSGHRGTFLPAVWRELVDPREFVRRLKLKAGLSADFWSPEIQIWRYSTTCYREADSSASRQGV